MTDDRSPFDLSLTMPLPHTALRPGERYRIVLTDCCAEGEFVGCFLGWEWPLTAHEGPLPRARFAGGGVLPGVAWLAYPA